MNKNEHYPGSFAHTSESKEKTSPVIRPEHLPAKSHKHRDASLRLNRKHAAKLSMNLLGVCILLVAFGVIVAQAERNFGGQTDSPGCIGQQLCRRDGTASAGADTPALRPTSARTLPFVTPALTSIATHVPTPAPETTATSIYPVLSVRPASITIPHYSYCSTHKTTMLIQLQNVGGQPVIWRQGTRTSPGFTLNVSPNGFLIEPGQTTRVRLSCVSRDVKGRYHLQIQYNGGTINVPIVVTDSTNDDF